MSTDSIVRPEDLDYLPANKREIAARRLNYGARAARQGTSESDQGQGQGQGSWKIPEPRADIAELVSRALMGTSDPNVDGHQKKVD